MILRSDTGPTPGAGDDPPRKHLGILAGRVRLPLLYLAVGLALLESFDLATVPAAVRWTVLLVALLLAFRVGAAGGPALRVDPPLRGRWHAVQTPDHKVPSHGLHAYAQTYALDLARPHDARGSRWWPLTQRAADYPSFGEPVLAVADGTVVRVRDWQRDHRSRDAYPVLPFVFVEGALREVLGPSGLLGNHIVLELDDGTFATYAHLRRRSARHETGQRVSVGQVIAECGNSGNSTEPHLHFQLQDRRSPIIAAGLPVAFDHLHDGDQLIDLPPAGRPVEFTPGRADNADHSG